MRGIVTFTLIAVSGCTQMVDDGNVFDPYDLDQDGVDEQAGDKVLALQPYTLSGIGQGKFPWIALDRALVRFDNGGYNGYGCGGNDLSNADWWGPPCMEMTRMVIDPDDDEETDNNLDVMAVEVTSPGVYRGNFKNADCQDPAASDANGPRCWAELESVSDEIVVKYETLVPGQDYSKGLCFEAREVVNDDGALELWLFETTDGCEATGEPS